MTHSLLLLPAFWGCAGDPTCGVGMREQHGICVAIEGRAPRRNGRAVREVYLLVGQSNMDGFGYAPMLPAGWVFPDARVPLYRPAWGEFRALQAASGAGPHAFGPEVGFGRTLAEHGATVALVKYALGGTDLAFYWYPGEAPADPSAGEGFLTLVGTMEAARRDLDVAGEAWRWAGLLWMQGEADALDVAMASAYEVNLERLIAAVRARTGEPELPAAIGLISRYPGWTWAEEVRAAQEAVALGDPWVVAIETDDLPRNRIDPGHYNTPGQQALGVRFARAMQSLEDVGAGADGEP